jgi:hypothetical protein
MRRTGAGRLLLRFAKKKPNIAPPIGSQLKKFVCKRHKRKPRRLPGLRRDYTQTFTKLAWRGNPLTLLLDPYAWTAHRPFLADFDGLHTIFGFHADAEPITDDNTNARGRALLNDRAAFGRRFLHDVKVGGQGGRGHGDQGRNSKKFRHTSPPMTVFLRHENDAAAVLFLANSD